MATQSNLARKESARKFKELPPHRGVYAVRCAATNSVWVGLSRNLPATKNGLWFQLRMGSGPDTPLQQQWNQLGEAAFRYEIVEELAADVHELAVEDQLKEKKAAWVQRLGASALL